MGKRASQVLIIGLFLSDKNRHKILRTAADQLKECFVDNGIEVISTSTIMNKWGRFVDTMTTIIFKRKSYKVAIVPLYGGTMSHIWERASSNLLKWLGKKVVVIVHSSSITTSMQKDPALYIQSFKRADVVVCPSTFFIEFLKDYGVGSVLIENVLNLDDYRFHKKEIFRPKILWMRTLEDVYNPEMAIRVANLLSKRYADFEMVMAGHDRGMLNITKQLAADMGVAGKVSFPGYINNSQKDQLAHEFDIYICTNRHDNAPVSFIEMMAMGLPIVSVNVGGIPHFVKHEYNGYLVNPDDDVAMADAIDRVINNPEKTKQLVENGIAFSKLFDEEVVVKKWTTLFSKLN
jgi:glycosyltransferase involved in cell wall biosynthesis